MEFRYHTSSNTESMLVWNQCRFTATTSGSAILLLAMRSGCFMLTTTYLGDAERMVGVEGIIHWEMLPNGCTITADLY